ncbi:MFS general substrate transporter [Rhizopogon vinicolor AM-OR11-026]|uniref:MFS general substrate transporter n=1 Tax=Rhizopogon vinicolor AM-OR11-026 TaxID=1314800 RepID=A0A1B7NFD5_9AGAM|nr:MFS general substrate transporter [Rhizopogon vinicolor AM-OR11-026]
MRSNRKPWGLRWRSSVWFITGGTTSCITTDLLAYSIIIPVLPFQLERLSYHEVSSLTGWLLFAYSVGLVLSTIPIAICSERYSSRRIPLLLGIIALLGSQVMFMEAPNFPVMALARVIQGISSSMVWIVGLALLCDTTPETSVGRQLGIAMTGLPLGLLVGSPAGGALYSRFGFRAPFIFGEICTLVDLFLRLLIIEKDVALKWGYGYDPSKPNVAAIDTSSAPVIHLTTLSTIPSIQAQKHLEMDTDELEYSMLSGKRQLIRDELPNEPRPSISQRSSILTSSPVRKPLPLLSVIGKLARSPRALVALTMSFVYGIVNSMQEPSLPLHLQDVWGYNSDQVGLVYLAALLPAMISSPVAGYIVDRQGPSYLTCICLLLTLPWWIVMTLRSSLPLFIFALAAQSFFVSGVISPVTTELAAEARNMPGVGYAHVYGAFNLAFGIGTAVGPVIGGQMYDHAKHGWTAVCCITAALIVICITLAFCYTGADPLLAKIMRQQYPLVVKKPDEESTSHSDAFTTD